MICRNCGQQLPDTQFEQYPTGTRRRVCRQCKYLLYGVKAKRKWRLRQLADFSESLK
jgi:hypothetical protein